MHAPPLNWSRLEAKENARAKKQTKCPKIQNAQTRPKANKAKEDHMTQMHNMPIKQIHNAQKQNND